jgi:excisionase family DNA binding protein
MSGPRVAEAFDRWSLEDGITLREAVLAAVAEGEDPMNLITLKVAAERVGTTPDNLRQAIARGSLKAMKVGRDWLVDPKEIDRYGAENRRPRAATPIVEAAS